jgi:hypothetical protein
VALSGMHRGILSRRVQHLVIRPHQTALAAIQDMCGSSSTEVAVPNSFPSRASPIRPAVDAVPFAMADHLAILTFRRKLRRRAIWVVVSPEHGEAPEAVEIYRPYEVPGQISASWLVWRSDACVCVYDKEAGMVGTPATVEEALEIVEAILKMEIRKAIRSIPPAIRPELPKSFGGSAYE